VPLVPLPARRQDHPQNSRGRRSLWIAGISLGQGGDWRPTSLLPPSMQPPSTLNRALDGVRFGLERPVAWSFRRLTRSRDNCPIPARLTLLVDLSKEHREPHFYFRHCPDPWQGGFQRFGAAP
jgi:hypothetical protein